MISDTNCLAFKSLKVFESFLIQVHTKEWVFHTPVESIQWVLPLHFSLNTNVPSTQFHYPIDCFSIRGQNSFRYNNKVVFFL